MFSERRAFLYSGKTITNSGEKDMKICCSGRWFREEANKNNI